MNGGRFVDAGGTRTYCIDRGSGPAVVLLHGAGFGVEALATWCRQIDALAAEHRVIAFDQIGFGQTGLPSDGRYRNRLERVDHALAVLGVLGLEKVVLVGHSEGAFMAARIAILRPGLVERLVLMTSGGT